MRNTETHCTVILACYMHAYVRTYILIDVPHIHIVYTSNEVDVFVMCDSYLLLLIVYTKVSPIWNCNVMMMGFEVLSSAHTPQR